jgi:hypothetical protein
MNDDRDERLFWRDGECFVGVFNGDTEISNLRIVRMDTNGKVFTIDAGFGMVDDSSIWDADTLSVRVNLKKTSTNILTPQNNLTLLRNPLRK